MRGKSKFTEYPEQLLCVVVDVAGDGPYGTHTAMLMKDFGS
jgi:hypothetical protein